jgi:replicative DNA helicase
VDEISTPVAQSDFVARLLEQANGAAKMPVDDGFDESLAEQIEVQTPPHDLDAEGAVLSVALVDPSALIKLKRIQLRAEDFFSEAHRRIYEACLAVEGIPDIVTVGSHLKQTGRLAQVGGMAYLTEVLNSAPAVANVERYATIVINLAKRRQLILECQRATALLYQPNGETAAILPSLQVAIRDVTLSHETRRTSHNLFEHWRDEGPLIHEPIQLGPIDEWTGGGPVYGSRWYILGAPDACKTAFIVQLADTFARRGLAVGLFAVDEEPDDMQTRIVQGYGAARKDCETRSSDFLFRMQREILERHKVPILYFGANDTIESASDELAEHGEKHRVRQIILYDSVQTIDCDAIRYARDEPTEYIRVTRNVYAIRAQASKHKQIAIATSEMNRESYKTIGNADPNPGESKMGAGKQSGAIEYSARVMLRFETAKARRNRKWQIVPDKYCVTVEKNKHGPRGKLFHIDLDRARMRLAEGPPPDDEEDEMSPGDEKRRERERQKEKQAQEERAREEERAFRQRQAEEQKAAELDAALLRVVERTPGIGSTEARSEVAAELRGCSRDRFMASVARLKLRSLLRIERVTRTGEQRLFLPETDSPPESDPE